MNKNSAAQKEEKKQIRENIDNVLPLPNPSTDKVAEQFVVWKGREVSAQSGKQSPKSDKICV